MQRRSLGAQSAEVGRMIRIAAHARDPIAGGLDDDAAANAAIVAGGFCFGLDANGSKPRPMLSHRDCLTGSWHPAPWLFRQYADVSFHGVGANISGAPLLFGASDISPHHHCAAAGFVSRVNGALTIR